MPEINSRHCLVMVSVSRISMKKFRPVSYNYDVEILSLKKVEIIRLVIYFVNSSSFSSS
jgi:hypothetical protein